MSLPATRVFSGASALTGALADALIEAADASIAVRGVFHLVLAGGATPQGLYRELARRKAGDARWHVWYGDERCLPPDHPERNSAMAETAWLADCAIPSMQRRPIPAERGAEVAAGVYAEWLERVPEFDLVLLGIGEDGHTASLFPGHAWHGAPVLAVHGAPKPPAERVSLSADRLSGSHTVWFVVTGANKHDALARWGAGETLPAAAVTGKSMTLLWLDAPPQGRSGLD